MTIKIAIGPMSPETIEAVFRVSNYERKKLMLIASKNQIDHNGGYVNNWDTKEYMDYIKKMKEIYTDSDVLICRDHCGPGFNGIDNLEDVYDTLKSDIENGFDLIHIDFCHFKGTREEKMAESKKAIKFCQNLNPNIKLEIGTDENIGTNFGFMNLSEIEKEMDFFKEFCNPQFYVVQTGSLIKEINQIGDFNKDFTKRIGDIIRARGMELKEHNADYLSREEIDARDGVVDAMNIAPQFGVIQTQIVLSKCLIYGIRFDDFLEEVYQGGKWKKWLNKNTDSNKFLCSVIAGHYHFGSESYKKIISELEKREDIKENIINELSLVIQHYQK